MGSRMRLSGISNGICGSKGPLGGLRNDVFVMISCIDVLLESQGFT
jgi:hypothetical protein